MSSGGVQKKLTLKSSDGETFEVEETVGLESQTIKQMVEDNHSTADTVIELPKVTSVILLKIMEYCKKHVEARVEFESEDELKKWDLDFIKVDQKTLFDLILAAHYLNIKSLLNLTCQTVANMIKGRTPAEIRKTFNIEANFTPEEEEEIRKENQWHFE